MIIDIDGPLLGKDYVKESLRQICIFKTNSENWWNYLNLYKTNCINSTLPEECTNILMNKTNIDKILVNKCILESFSGTDEDLDDNKLLKEDHERFKNEAIQIWPSILINNMIYKVQLFIIYKQYMNFFREQWILH